MNLEFCHEVKGIWGFYDISEYCWCFDDEVLRMIFRELRKDRNAVLWIVDVSEEVDFENIVNISLCWETWEDYDNYDITLTIWKSWNSRESKKIKWEKGKRIFREIIKKAKNGDVKANDIEMK